MDRNTTWSCTDERSEPASRARRHRARHSDHRWDAVRAREVYALPVRPDVARTADHYRAFKAPWRPSTARAELAQCAAGAGAPTSGNGRSESFPSNPAAGTSGLAT